MVVWLDGNSPHGNFCQSFLHTELHVSLHMKCLLFFPNLKQNWNVLTNSSKAPQYQIS
jgi:hypothetical protein